MGLSGIWIKKNSKKQRQKEGALRDLYGQLNKNQHFGPPQVKVFLPLCKENVG